MENDKTEELIDVILEAFGYNRFDLEKCSYREKLKNLYEEIGELATRNYVTQQLKNKEISHLKYHHWNE